MEYKTVKQEATGEFVEKRSRFLCHVKPVKTPEEAAAFINEKKSEYWDAKHNVYAYVLRENNITRYSDDGEPQGTAGMPVLDVLVHEKVYDAVVVITRYFGGILLGTGGLVRAYARGAKEALNAGGIATMCLCGRYEMSMSYSQFDRMKQILSKYSAVVCDTRYTDSIAVEFLIKKSDAEAFQKDVTDSANGTITPIFLSEGFEAI